MQESVLSLIEVLLADIFLLELFDEELPRNLLCRGSYSRGFPPTYTQLLPVSPQWFWQKYKLDVAKASLSELGSVQSPLVQRVDLVSSSIQADRTSLSYLTNILFELAEHREDSEELVQAQGVVWDLEVERVLVVEPRLDVKLVLEDFLPS
ncbi:hypothetical protein V6N11_049744 [Hibiscus sabdariffa]|uniref:Uncharacterized protein n=1 Tax=Hibiscus sabdariffa TaxID=183260 RepID=A0ABR2T867_9ROSI